MPPLRAHRRDRRSRAPKARRRRNLTKFVPSSDSDFAMTARNFANHVWEHREELGIEERDAEYLCRLVKHFRDALAVTRNKATRTTSAVENKKRWRKEAEEWLRMIGRKIRGDPTVERSHKVALRLVGLSSRKKETTCPQRPPVLQFIGSGDGVDGGVGAGNGSGVHVLDVYDMHHEVNKPAIGKYRKARPDGASRLELWVGFIPQGMPVPGSVQEYVATGYGWPLYLRSFATHRIEVQFPMPDRPMLIVYWARWANNAGDCGRCCKTVVARVEGWSKGPGELPESVRGPQGSQVSIQHGSQLPLPAAGARSIEPRPIQATFLLVGTPFALPVGECDVDGGGLVEERAILPEAG